MKCVNQFLDYMWTHPDSCNYPVPCFWHDSQCSLWCVLPLCTKVMQPGRWLYFPRQFTMQRRPNQTQWSHPRHMHHPQACCGFHCRSWTGGTFLECTRSESFSTNPCQTQPSATTHTNTHQQHNNSRYCQQHHQMQQSRSMEMRYFWLLDGETQRYFKFYYQPGLENLGDYPSKHHTADIHQHVQPYHVHMDISPTLLPQAMKPSTCWGCAEILGDPYSKKSHYQAWALPLVWPSPLQIPVTEYLASQEYNREIPLTTTIQEYMHNRST